MYQVINKQNMNIKVRIPHSTHHCRHLRSVLAAAGVASYLGVTVMKI